MLPKRDRLDEAAYKRGQIVSEFRERCAWIIDMVIIMIPVLAAMLLLWHDAYNYQENGAGFGI